MDNGLSPVMRTLAYLMVYSSAARPSKSVIDAIVTWVPVSVSSDGLGAKIRHFGTFTLIKNISALLPTR